MFRSSVSRYLRNEEGVLIVFGLFLFIVMLMMGGLAIDLMRHENSRVQLQNALDRSTLAAASLNQSLNREAVVRDYMAKAGLADALESIKVTATMDATEVVAQGSVDTRPMFLHMLGIDQFDAHGASGAGQSVSRLEIVLVLDVSGSMSGTKIANLKLAAKAFVDTILDNDPYKRASIAIVPYNAQVNIGPDLVSQFSIIHHNNVADTNCIELPATSFDGLAISRSDFLPMMAYADIANSTSRVTSFLSPTASTAVPNFGSSFCKPSTVNVVRLPNNDRDVLKGQIDALMAGGNTSITIGMKWGATLIDPSMASAYDSLIADKKIPAELAKRPAAYSDADTRKIIVLMTDGEHVAHNRVNDAFKTGASPIFKAPDGFYSIQHLTDRPAAAGSNEYFVPHLCASTPCQTGYDTSEAWQSTPWAGGGDAVRQDWRDIWASLRMTYVAWQFYGRALGTDTGSRDAAYSAQLAAMRSNWASVAGMDKSLDATCDQVKAMGVTVYGVTVSAPENGQAVIKSCATTVDAHYFEAKPETVVSAFKTIASNITMLKLTQ